MGLSDLISGTDCKHSILQCFVAYLIQIKSVAKGDHFLDCTTYKIYDKKPSSSR